MNPQKRREIFARFKAANPEPKTELIYATPFQLLVAVVLSAQATDKSVNQATQKLFRVAPTPEKMLALGMAGLEPYISKIGLYRSKARHVIGLCQSLLEQFNGEVPADREALQRLPGVGRKSANVILNTIFGLDTIAVDTHVFRVANRTGIAPGDTVMEVELKLLKFIEAPYRRHAHHWLILHGRYTCQARKPLCPNCLILDLCEYRAKTTLLDAPIRGRKT